MTAAMVALANITLGSAQSTVTFSSIPGTYYRDLLLIAQPQKSTAGGGTMRLQLNGDTGSNYSHVGAIAEAGTVFSVSATGTFMGIGYWNGDSIANTVQWSVMDYSATDKHKSVLARSGNPSAIIGMAAARWASTSAVTSLNISNDGGNFSAGSTFALYGIVS